MSQKNYYFNLDYLFKRGDICIYCGTIFRIRHDVAGFRFFDDRVLGRV